MKKIRIVIACILIAFVGIAWYTQVSSIFSREKIYKNLIIEADECISKGLYQKAIMAYDEALTMKKDKEVREKWLYANEMAMEEGTINKGKYTEVLKKMCTEYPDNILYWEMLLRNYLEMGDYSSAYKTYNKAVNENVKSEKLDLLGIEICYSFDVFKSTYSNICGGPEGYYAVYNEHAWGIMAPNADWIQECEFQYVSPINSKKIACFVTSTGKRLIDNNGVVQAIIDIEFDAARTYADGIIPIYKDNEWKYLETTTNTIILDDLEDASSFKNGIATIKKNGQWIFVNQSAEKISDIMFDDVKLYGNGEYTYENRMIAAVKGEYGLYDSKGVEVINFKAKNADLYMGDYIAYQDNSGKWGYVNEKGEIVIPPQFDNAKSFSNELAAVCLGEEWGFIDRTGKMVIDYQFADAMYFSKEGMAFVSTFNGYYYVIKLRF